MRRTLCLLAILMLVALVRPSRGQSISLAALDPGDVVAGELLVTFGPDVSAAQQAAAIQPDGGTIIGRLPALNLAAVRFERLGGRFDPQATTDLITALERTPGVTAVQPNYRMRVIDGEQVSPPEPAARAAALDQQSFLPVVWNADTRAFVPDDPDLTKQYAWTTIHAFPAWAVDHHYAGVVAVVDTGVDATHPDLKEHIIAGYDVIDGDAVAQDGYGHGTHVAGTVAAVSDNGQGVAGTCPACLVMPVRVLDNWGYGTDFTVAQGMVYAADHGAQVINLSLGGPESEVVRKALIYAWDKGTLPVCAAGNSGSDDPYYGFPASDDHCLAVASTNIYDQLSYFSNFGPWVDIAAPGELIYSTYPGGEYIWASGTSMATPHVAGAAGMLAGSGMNRDQIRARLLSTADPITGTNIFFSNGRLNLQRALGNN